MYCFCWKTKLLTKIIENNYSKKEEKHPSKNDLPVDEDFSRIRIIEKTKNLLEATHPLALLPKIFDRYIVY